MPVRSIPKNHVSVTGRHSTDKSIGDADFESPLENDYLILLDFDPDVERYEVQPVRVPVPGVSRGYVPDVLVHFRLDPSGARRDSELTEVKAKDDYPTQFRQRFPITNRETCRERPTMQSSIISRVCVERFPGI